MTQPLKPATSTPDRAETDRQARLVREAAALRENLRRRKQQTRARQDGEQDHSTSPSTIAPDSVLD